MIKEKSTMTEANTPAIGFENDLPNRLIARKPSNGKTGISQANWSMCS
jgi:hypothetical protein